MLINDILLVCVTSTFIVTMVSTAVAVKYKSAKYRAHCLVPAFIGIVLCSYIALANYNDARAIEALTETEYLEYRLSQVDKYTIYNSADNSTYILPVEIPDFPFTVKKLQGSEFVDVEIKSEEEMPATVGILWLIYGMDAENSSQVVRVTSVGSLLKDYAEKDEQVFCFYNTEENEMNGMVSIAMDKELSVKDSSIWEKLFMLQVIYTVVLLVDSVVNYRQSKKERSGR